MFTGIITDVGKLENRSQETGGDLKLRIATRYDLGGVALGASISCNGTCLTVTARDLAGAENGFQGVFSVDVSAETVAKTTLGDWRTGRLVNLERALKVGDELGGHIVSGHVDGVGEVISMTEEGDSTRVLIRAPLSLAPYIATKGSIAVDGCSLTVNTVEDQKEGAVFGLNLIPHTKRETCFSRLATGDRVNLEIDMLARYVARLRSAGS